MFRRGIGKPTMLCTPVFELSLRSDGFCGLVRISLHTGFWSPALEKSPLGTLARFCSYVCLLLEG
jgi:hypothetical protein